MTLKSNGYKIICDREQCGRIQELPVAGLAAEALGKAAKMATDLGWWCGERDFCPECVPIMQASGKLPARGQ